MSADIAERKTAPVQGWPHGIPWSLHLEAYAAYCKKWSPQTALIEGWCRGGFSTDELDEFIPGWRERAGEIPALRAINADLLAALREALVEWNTQFEGEQDNDPWCIAARAAIAKAEGASS